MIIELLLKLKHKNYRNYNPDTLKWCLNIYLVINDLNDTSLSWTYKCKDYDKYKKKYDYHGAQANDNAKKCYIA